MLLPWPAVASHPSEGALSNPPSWRQQYSLPSRQTYSSRSTGCGRGVAVLAGWMKTETAPLTCSAWCRSEHRCLSLLSRTRVRLPVGTCVSSGCVCVAEASPQSCVRACARALVRPEHCRLQRLPYRSGNPPPHSP